MTFLIALLAIPAVAIGLSIWVLIGMKQAMSRNDNEPRR